jgi:hypothetical protein
VLLAACSPVKMGSAAIVGNQRITTATLDTDVSNLQQAITQYGGSQVTASQYPQAVLGWLVRFAIRDEVARANGITVSQADIDSAITDVNAEQQEAAEEDGVSYPGLTALLAQNGLPPNLEKAFGQWEAQELAFIEKMNGGKLPSASDSTAQNNAVAEVTKADCQAAQSLNIQINPQFGQLSYDSSSELFGVSTPTSLLSAPTGARAATAAPTFPAC